jgi:septal ring factor EnvC (AmiA/AmiB activator)
MRNRLNSRLFVPVIMLLIMAIAVPFAYAQKDKKKTTKSKPKTEKKENKADLEARKTNLQSEIDLTNKLLAETRRNKTLSLSQLVALNKKIEAREALIATINEEIANLDAQIVDKQAEIVLEDSSLAQMKREYAQMVVFAYRNRNAYSNVMFLFSSEGFNQAYLRLKYLQLISVSRKLQAQRIAIKQQELNDQLASLETDKAEKKALLGNEETEQQTLAKEKDDKDATFRGLQTKEANLKADLAKKNTQKANTDSAIARLLREEIAKQVAAAAAAAATPKPTASNNSTTPKSGTPPKAGTPAPKTTTPPAQTKVTLTPEAKTLGENFASNQGKLPWPVERGTIVSKFGKHPHPVLKGVTTQNNGIDISVSSGSMARAVFDGECTGLTNIPGSGWLVIIRHGEYLTVYSQLEEALVKVGDKVKTKQNIGKVATDQQEGTTELHFEVWKSGGIKLNPESWIAK